MQQQCCHAVFFEPSNTELFVASGLHGCAPANMQQPTHGKKCQRIRKCAAQAQEQSKEGGPGISSALHKKSAWHSKQVPTLVRHTFGRIRLPHWSGTPNSILLLPLFGLRGQGRLAS